MADIIPAPAAVYVDVAKMKAPASDVRLGGAEGGERLTARLDAAAARAEVQKAAMQHSRSGYGGALSPTAEIELPGDNELVAIWTDAESIVTLRARCAELESEGFELRERLVEVEAAEQSRSKGLQEEYASMAAQAKSAAAENSALHHQLADSHAVQAEIPNLHKQLADLANAKAEAESASAAEVSHLHQQLADLRAAGDASSKATMEAESAAAEEISRLRQQLATVHAADDATSQAKDEVERTLRSENSSLQQQLADLRAAEAASSKAKAEAEAAGSAEVSSLHKKLADLAKAKAEADAAATSKTSDLHQQVSDLRAALDASAKAHAEAEDAMEKELGSLREQLSSARAAEVAATKAKDEAQSTLTAENASLLQQLVDLRAAQEVRAAEDAKAEEKADWESPVAAENLRLQNQLAELQIIAEEEKRQQEEQVAELREQIRTMREDSSQSAVISHERKRPGVQFAGRRQVRWYEPQEPTQDTGIHRSKSLPTYSLNFAGSDRALNQAEPGTQQGRRQETPQGEAAQQADDALQWTASASETEDQGFTSEDYHGNEGSDEELVEDEEEEGSLGSEDVYQEDEEDEAIEDAIKDLEDCKEEETEDDEGYEHSQEDPYEDEELWAAGQDDARHLSAVEEEGTEQEEDPYDDRSKEEGIYSECDSNACVAGSQASRLQDAADDASFRKITFSDKVSMAAKSSVHTGQWLPTDSPPSVQVPSQLLGFDSVNRVSLTKRGLRAPVGNGTLHAGNESARTHSMSPEPSARPSGESKTPPVPAMALPRASSPNAFTTFQGRMLPHTTRASPSFGSPRQSCQLRPQPIGNAGSGTGQGDMDSARAITPSARIVPISSPLRPATQTTTSTPILAGKSPVAATSSSSGANPNEAPAPGLLAGAVSAGAVAAKATNSGSSAAQPGTAVGGTSVRVAQAVQRLQGAMVTPIKQRPEDIGRAQYTYVSETSGVPVRSLPATSGPSGPAGAATAPGCVAGDRGVATPPQCQPRLTHAGVALVRPANWPPA